MHTLPAPCTVVAIHCFILLCVCERAHACELVISETQSPMKAQKSIFALTLNYPTQVGPFLGNGLDFKGSGILAIFRYPT
eukprot:scaffold169145_cov18-Tisochrysis_lutea.AAC.4